MVVILAIAYLEISLSVHSNLARQYKQNFFCGIRIARKKEAQFHKISPIVIYSHDEQSNYKVKIKFQILL